MSLSYRSIWRDPWEGVASATVATFGEWLSGKHGIDASAGHAQSETASARVATAVSDGISAWEGTVVERADDGAEITLAVRCLRREQVAEAWVWVDLSRVAPHYFEWAPMHAPRIVRELINRSLKEGGSPASGGVALATQPVPVPPTSVAALAGIIEAQSRNLPVVVFSHRADDPHRDVRAKRAAHILSGIARVFVLTGDATDPFREAIGADLGVWGGAARLYLPGALDPSRHRYLPWAQMHRAPEMAGNVLSTILRPFVTSRPAPVEYRSVRTQLLGVQDTDYSELLELADSELEAREKELEEERDRAAQLADEVLKLQLEVQEQNQLLVRLQQSFGSTSKAERGEELTELDNFDPAGIGSVREAVEHARGLFRPLVSIPDGVDETVDECDETPEASAWGLSAWRALRALYNYASSGFDGDFFAYCQSSGESEWPATSKKLAMRESETVMANSTFRNQRNLPIVRDGKLEQELMESHIKIATGGGPLAPRIYFLVERTDDDRRVHIGFVGPHRYMENTKTN